MTLPEGKIINADDIEIVVLINGVTANHPQQRIIAHRHHQAMGESSSRSASKRQAKVMDDLSSR